MPPLAPPGFSPAGKANAGQRSRDFGDEIFRSAGAADQEFLAVCAGQGFECRSCLALHPATGTLEIRADLRTKIEKPLSRKSCILDLGVYLGDALVDRGKLRFQHRYAVLEALDGVRRLVQKKLVDIHRSAEPG
jgi:hypothetical protein